MFRKKKQEPEKVSETMYLNLLHDVESMVKDYLDRELMCLKRLEIEISDCIVNDIAWFAIPYNKDKTSQANLNEAIQSANDTMFREKSGTQYSVPRIETLFTKLATMYGGAFRQYCENAKAAYMTTLGINDKVFIDKLFAEIPFLALMPELRQAWIVVAPDSN